MTPRKHAIPALGEPAATAARTLRLPPSLLTEVQRVKADAESVNAFITTAVQREVHRRQALAAHARITTLRRQVRARTGPQPEVAALIRDLRDGRGRDA